MRRNFINHDTPCGDAVAFAIGVRKTSALRQAINFLHYSGVPSGGKFLSAFCASSLNDSSAVRGGHSLSESVHFASLSFLGLISSFHLYYPRFMIVFSLFARRTPKYRAAPMHEYYILYNIFCQIYFRCFRPKKRSSVSATRFPQTCFRSRQSDLPWQVRSATLSFRRSALSCRTTSPYRL